MKSTEPANKLLIDQGSNLSQLLPSGVQGIEAVLVGSPLLQGTFSPEIKIPELSCDAHEVTAINKELENTYASMIDCWTEQYHRTQRPVRVNFSQITPQYNIKDKATHLVHFYPAKLISQIPEFFISALSRCNDYVFDPFAGSGTVLLEAILAGRRPIAAELNPVARLITRVKTTPIPAAILETETERLISSIDLRKHSIKKIPSNLFFWHAPLVIRQLSAILAAIRSWNPICEERYRDAVKDFFYLTFSSIIRKKSLADPRVAPPVKVKPEKFKHDHVRFKRTQAMLTAKQKPDCLEVFRRAIEDQIRRVDSLYNQLGETAKPCVFVADDVKNLSIDGSFSVNLIVSSPPYIAAQKYTRSTSLELFWLGYLKDTKDRAAIEHCMVGSEIAQLKRGQKRPQTGIPAVDRLIKKIWPLSRGRAKIVANYFSDMITILNKLYHILVPGGHFVLIVGNNTVCGEPIAVSRILKDICVQRIGFSCKALLVDRIKNYGFMTKRNHTAGIITREYVLIMQKPLP